MIIRSVPFIAPALVALLFAGCSADVSPSGTGGTSAGGTSAGSGTGGAATGGAATGGAATGGAATGGVATGGGGGAGSGGGGATSTGGASSSGGGENTTYPPTFATFKTEVFPQCTGGLCHDFGPEHPFYFKNDANLYTALTTHTSKNCGPVITKGNPESSALIKLLKGPCGETNRMPLDKCQNTDPQDSEYCVKPPLLAALEEWIRRGAPEND